MSVSSIVSPTSPGSGEQRRFDRPSSLEAGATLGDNLGQGGPRRESVDSRINQGISDMRLGGSPYTSNNQSTSSIQNTLQQQRNPRPGLDALSVHRISNGYQPSNDRNPEPKIARTAPAITGPATGNIARAAEPTKGQAWAFPEEEIKRINHQPSFDDSRRSSVTESIASSQFTTESRLPPGQRRLEDSGEFARIQTGGDFPSVHHHSMQHKQLSDLQADMGPGGAQPYSRTPELRVSHKLAERKRRTEMKELFDQLRDLMPQERGSKASKWEILTKAIAEHQRQGDHLRAVQTHYSTAVNENDLLRHELHQMRVEMAQMRGEMSSTNGHASASAHQSSTPASQAPAAPSSYASDQQQQQQHTPQQQQYPATSGTELPPLRSISNGISAAAPAAPGPDSMTGVQYDRPNGYRNERY